MMQSAVCETSAVTVDFPLCDQSYAVMADALCTVPRMFKGVSDSPSLNSALGDFADQLTFALMEAHTFATQNCPDEGAGLFLDLGRAILFEDMHGVLRFGVDGTKGTTVFEAAPNTTMRDAAVIPITPALSGRHDLMLHDVQAVMQTVTQTIASMAPIAALALAIGRDDSGITLSVEVSLLDDPDTMLSLEALKQQFVLTNSPR